MNNKLWTSVITALVASAALVQGQHSDPGQQAEHMALHGLLDTATATHVAGNGDWSNPITWGGAGVPTAGDKVHIPDGVTVTYDVSSSASLDWIRSDGDLVFRHDIDTKVVVETLVILETGSITIGTESNPINASKTAEIIIDTSGGPLSETTDPTLVGRGVISHGQTTIYGADKKDFTTLAGDALANSSYVELSDASIPTGWQAGDTLVLGGTWYDENGNDDDNSRFHDEVLEITNMSMVNGKVRVYFDNITNDAAVSAGRTTLLWDHERMDGVTFDPSETPLYIANLTRNVRFSSSDPTVDNQERGHFMVMHNPNAKVYHAGFYDLGRSDKRFLVDDPAALGNIDGRPANGTNPRGRYALHFHRTGDDDINGTRGEVVGNAVWGSPGHGIVHHDSHLLVQDCVVFDVIGSNFFTEFGTELGAWIDNLSIKTRGKDPDLQMVTFTEGPGSGPETIEDNDRRENLDLGYLGSAYWVQGGPGMVFDGNIAISFNSVGFDLFSDSAVVPGSIPSTIEIANIANTAVRDALLAAGITEAELSHVPNADIKNTTLYNSPFCGVFTYQHQRHQGVTGIFTFQDSSTSSDNIGHDFGTWFDGLTVWGVKKGVFNYYSGNVHLKDALLVGDVENPVSFQSAPGNAEPGYGYGIGGNQVPVNGTYQNIRVEGFQVGVKRNEYTWLPEPVQGLINSEIAAEWPIIPDVKWDLDDTYPSGTGEPEIESNYAYWPYRIVNTTFHAPADSDPVADFSSSSVGGLAIRLDGNASSDSDPLPFVLGNGIAAYGWDVDSDGIIDEWGETVDHTFASTGDHQVTLTVWDGRGQSDSVQNTVSVSAVAYPNALLNADFATNDFDNQYWNISSDDTNNGWTIEGMQWNSGIGSGGALESEVNGDYGQPRALAQSIFDHRVARGTQTLAFDYLNTESDSTSNEIQVRVWGFNTQFKARTHRTPWVERFSGYDYDATLLLDETINPSTVSSWTTADFDAEFGDGYEFIYVLFSIWGVDGNAGDYVAIDNVSLTGAAPSANLLIEAEDYDNTSNFAPFQVQSDGTASNGEFIVCPSGNNYSASNSDTGQAHYEFSLSGSADVVLWARVNFDNNVNDSLFYRIEGVDGSTQWRNQNNTQTNGWEWIQLRDYGNVSAGDYTIKLLRREDGSKIDALYLSTDGSTP